MIAFMLRHLLVLGVDILVAGSVVAYFMIADWLDQRQEQEKLDRAKGFTSRMR